MSKQNKIKWWSWVMSDKERANQVDNYHSLKLWQSYRGMSIILVIISLLATFIFNFFDNYLDLKDILYYLIIYIPLLIFVYNGKSWAIITLMALETLENGYLVFDGDLVIMAILWWLLIMSIFSKALMVEIIRRKQKAEVNKNNYCHKCGEQIVQETKACSKCGEKLIDGKKKEKMKTLLNIIFGLIMAFLIVALIFFAYEYEDEYVDNYEDEPFMSLLEMFNPYIEPVGYYSRPELYDNNDIEISEWWSYVSYFNEDEILETTLLKTNIPNQTEIFSSVVKIVCEDADNYYTGSGTNFDESGYVLTNLHVVENADQCAIGFADPRSGLIEELYWATPIIDKDNITGHDLAYLSIEGPVFDDELNVYGYIDKVNNAQFPYFQIREECTEKEIQLGESIFVIGYPYLGGDALTVTNGLISSLYSRDGYLITSAKINSGNSGGLAIDQLGCYVGVPTAVYHEEGEESFGEIIDAEFVDEFDEAVLDDLQEYYDNL